MALSEILNSRCNLIPEASILVTQPSVEIASTKNHQMKQNSR